MIPYNAALLSVPFVIALLALSALVACEREGPPRPVGTATNKHVEESPARPPKGAADALTEAVKAPMDKARQKDRERR